MQLVYFPKYIVPVIQPRRYSIAWTSSRVMHPSKSIRAYKNYGVTASSCSIPTLGLMERSLVFHMEFKLHILLAPSH